MTYIALLSTILLVFCNSQKELFGWGSATAAYQIEGAIKEDGRLPSIWDTFCDTSGKINNNDSGAIADDDYHRFLEDIELMKALNLTHYRFSISWPRIFPDGETLNQKGLDHYQKVIDALIAVDIRPFVTLYHWDLPQAVFDATNGGWINSDIVDYFVKYADTVFNAFNTQVKRWVTFNEPWTFCTEGYDYGVHAPGRCSARNWCAVGNSSTEPYLCSHNVLLSHAATVKLFRDKGYAAAGGQIGMTINSDWAEPASNNETDRKAAQRNLQFKCGWYADPIWFGDYPQIMKELVGDRLPQFTQQQSQLLKGSYDFFALNHYTTAWVMDVACYDGPNPDWNSDQCASISAYNQYNKTVIGTPAESNWLYVVPWGVNKMLHWISDRYGNPPIYITENGVDVPGENNMTLDQVLNDTFRVNFYRQYIGNSLKAKSEGVNLKSYIAWSLMDNFEWADGYSKRFGLHFVNYTGNCTRYAKASAKWYGAYAQKNPYGDYQVHVKLEGEVY